MVYSYSFSHGFSATVGAAVCCCRRDSIIATSSTAYAEEADSSDKYDSRKRLLIFVNPRSGPGRSAQIFGRQVAPKLKENGIKYDLVITERVNHARFHVATLDDLHSYSAILIVSGDGLVFEVINALLERQDNPCIPIGIIPSGSGNGLLSSVFYHCRLSLKKNDFLARAISSACNSDALAYPVNLMHVETPNKSYAAFISVGFGLFADIDIESEKWRKTLESARFTAGALVRFFNLRTYRCKLSFCQNSDLDDTTNLVFPKPFKVYREEKNPSEGVLQEQQPCSSSNIESSNSILSDCLRQSYFQKGMPKISDPVPSDWTVIEDEFIFIYALTVSHAGQDIPYAPEASLCDKNIYLTYALKKDLRGKFELFKFLSDIKHAQHLKYPFFKVVPVKSFRLEKTEEPSAGGYVSVDGEVVECSMLHATNTSSTFSVIAG